MTQGQRKYGLADFLTSYFGSFLKILTVNLLFCVPLAVFSGILFAVFYFTGTLNILEVFLLIPCLSPFMGGMVYVCKKLTTRSEIHPWTDFIKGVADNWKFFFINSVFVYVITMGLYITFVFFRENLDNPMVIVYLIFSVLVTFFFLFTELSVTVMAVSVDLKPNELLKNSVMLVIGGFWQHLKTVLSLMFVGSVVLSVMALINHRIIGLIVLAVMILVCLPILCTYIFVYNSYQTIERTVIVPYMKEYKKQQEQKEWEDSERNITIEELEALSKGDPEEYVYLAGRMVKRRTVLKMLETKKKLIDFHD